MSEPGHFRQARDLALSTGVVHSAQDRNHAALAHLLGAAVGVLSAGLLLPVAAPTLVLAFSGKRSPFVLFHVNQAATFQAVVTVTTAIGWLLFATLYLATCGIGVVLLPLALLPWLASVLVPCWLAWRAYEGRWDGYPILGEWVLNQTSPFIAE